jgi:hypothetical protein
MAGQTLKLFGAQVSIANYAPIPVLICFSLRVIDGVLIYNKLGELVDTIFTEGYKALCVSGSECV